MGDVAPEGELSRERFLRPGMIDSYTDVPVIHGTVPGIRRPPGTVGDPAADRLPGFAAVSSEGDLPGGRLHSTARKSDVTETITSTSFATGDIPRLHAQRVTTLDELHAINGVPKETTRTKDTPFLTPLMAEFIARSPFCLIATANADGSCDVSPKGDPPGAVRVLDARTIAIPDRLGNRRIDGFQNILTNPHVGLIFLIPNDDETLRVNGRAFITKDPAFLESMAMAGRVPKLAMIVEVDEAYMHCARAFLRSGLWKPETWPDPESIPTTAAIVSEQRSLPAPDESAGKRREEYRATLY